ncbi:MAG: response regulator [Bacteroidia bacterium]|nr:response regulator [Bacteroidia bacterium]
MTAADKYKVDLAYIIDDDEVIIYLTQLLVKNVDFCERLSSFTSAEQAMESLLEAIKTGKDVPSVILIDLNMPIKDGWVFLDELSALNIQQNIPVFIFTSSINPVDMERALSYKIVKDYIIKPLTIQKVSKIMRLIQ